MIIHALFSQSYILGKQFILLFLYCMKHYECVARKCKIKKSEVIGTMPYS